MSDARFPAAALLRLPLNGLYPAGYRAAHGEEITAVFADAVEHADRRTALREWAALAAHALRLRTRLSSRDPGGRITAGAAPFLLAGGAALALVQLLTGLLTRSSVGTATAAVDAVQTVPWVLALLCVALRRQGAARALVLVALAARIGVAAVAQVHPAAGFARATELFGLWVVLAVLVLIAPPDAVDTSRRGRSWTMASAVTIALPLSTVAVLWIGAWPEDYADVLFTPLTQAALDTSTACPALVLALAYLVQLGNPDTDRLAAAGVALAVLPWTVMVAPPLYRSVPVDAHDLLRNGGVVLALLVAATAGGLLLRSRRRTRPDPTP
ncbi:hypothetical protein [Kitasatospora sp. NPDC002040]|uniref:hypothetical protein n=1 Tax=Kitasatospora sp. NPDC002040 TaxID=3154661 RepID=UPI00332EC441